MLLKQIVREKSVPLSLSLDSSNAVYADLLEAQSDRLNGYKGRNARDVLRDMEDVQSRSSLVDPKAWAGRSRFKKMLEKVLRVFSIWM